jgi:hypothetical protein
MASKIYNLSLFFFLCCQNINAQNDTSIFLKDIGWRINLPIDFKISNNQFISRTVDVRTLLTASNAGGDFLNIACDSSDKLTRKNWQASDQFYIATILNAVGLKNCESLNHRDWRYLIDKKDFKIYQMDCTKHDHSILHLFFISGFHNNHYILVNYFFYGNAYEIFAMLKTSKFE